MAIPTRAVTQVIAWVTAYAKCFREPAVGLMAIRMLHPVVIVQAGAIRLLLLVHLHLADPLLLAVAEAAVERVAAEVLQADEEVDNKS